MVTDFTRHMTDAEQVIFAQFSSDDNSCPIFIIGSPRTGSTILYQAMINYFNLPYISNLTNEHFASTPVVGVAIQKDLSIDAGWLNEFGKTKGVFQPSEGSAVIMNWFGGGHPSQIKSNTIIDGMEPHFLKTLSAIENMRGLPLLIKNPWNCFRLKYLRERLPHARFIWIRRDILTSAKSDLKARYLTKKSLDMWNSATPANVCDLEKLPPYKQVVENQYEFTKAIFESMLNIPPHLLLELWYEDLVFDSVKEIRKISHFIQVEGVEIKKNGIRKQNERSLQYQDTEDYNISSYVKGNPRFKNCEYKNKGLL